MALAYYDFQTKFMIDSNTFDFYTNGYGYGCVNESTAKKGCHSYIKIFLKSTIGR